MLCDQLTIRDATASDLPAVRAIYESALASSGGAALVERLSEGQDETISLLAECDGEPAGHLLLVGLDGPLPAAGLVPVAVMPRFRDMQVGTMLVRQGIARSRDAGYQAIFVRGDPGYYERFGFSAKLAAPFDAPWKGPRFMALELVAGSLASKSGVLAYPDAFHAG